jgi:flagellar hook protein FlgE
VFSSPLRAPAESVDLLAEVYNEGAAFLGLENGDELEVNANVGGQLLGGNKSHVYHSATSTIQDLLDLIKDELKLPLTDATPQKKLSVSINAASSDDNLDDGSIVVRGSQGLDFRISGLTITATNSDGDNWMPSFFMKNVVTKVIQEPRDNTKHKTSIDIYDALGISYKMDVLFVHNNEPGVWRWYLEFPEGGEVITAGEGDLTFGLQGTVSRAIADDKMGTVTFVPKNGSEKVLFLLEFGGPENFEGITQFEDETTAEALAQDGNAPGFLY